MNWNSCQLSTWVHKCHHVVDDIYIWHYTPFFSKRNTKNFFTVWNNWFFTPAETWLWQLPEHGFIFFKTFESELWIFTLSNSLWTLYVKFIFSEKATNFCEISTVDLCYVVTVKSTMEISQNFVAFSEYINFK